MTIINPLHTLNEEGLSNIYNYEDIAFPPPTLDKGAAPAERTMDSWLEKLTNPQDASTFILNTLSPSIAGDILEPNTFMSAMHQCMAELDKQILSASDDSVKNTLLELKKDMGLQLRNQDFINELRKILVQG